MRSAYPLIKYLGCCLQIKNCSENLCSTFGLELILLCDQVYWSRQEQPTPYKWSAMESLVDQVHVSTCLCPSALESVNCGGVCHLRTF